MLLNMNQIPLYLPSLYGDVKLTAQGDKTEIAWENLSPTEREALTQVGRKFDFGWEGDEGTVLVAKPIAKVSTALAKAMKRGRKLLSAVVFKNGRIEEMHQTERGLETRREPYREPAGATGAAVVAAAAVAAAEAPKAAVTVAAPTLGCPVPEFERADIRATRVLKAFLSAQQLEDFERTQSFLVTGGDTGRQYILTSRQAPAERLARVGGRSVFDTVDQAPICVHDWVVPAAEELLELKLFLELPGREMYCRHLDPVAHALPQV